MLALQRIDMERRGATPSTGVKSPRAFSGVAAAKPAASALSTVLRMYVLARRCGAGAGIFSSFEYEIEYNRIEEYLHQCFFTLVG